MSQQPLELLNALQKTVAEVRAVMLAASDGIPLAHNFPEADSGRIAAMATAALGLGKRVTQATQMGDLSETIIRGEKGYLLIFACGLKGVLIVAAGLNVNLGRLSLESRTSAARLAQLL
jgi:predicted regulator of Ras-like GTPase activity (Roadblock/LC7/MglB family)